MWLCWGMQIPKLGIARLDYYVNERRFALDLTRPQMFARGGPSPSTMSKALSGNRGLSSITLDRIDRSLGWAPGSAQSVLDGGIPTSEIPARSDAGGCPAHDHVPSILESVRIQLQCANELLEGLLGGVDAR